METNILLILIGALFLAAGIFDWDWFMESRRASFIIKFIGGRERGRVFYIVLGVAALILSALTIFGII